MKLETRKNYSIILNDSTANKDNSDSFIVNHICKYLIKINEEAGLTQGMTMFGDCLSVSNEDYPSANYFVISKIDRKHESFELINVTENKWDILFQVCELNTKDEAEHELIKFIKSNLKYEKDLDLLLYYILNLKQECIKEGNFNSNKADVVLNSLKEIYKSNGNRTEQFIATINFIRNPNETLLFTMLKTYNNDYKQLVNNLTALMDNRLPKNLVDMFSEAIGSKIFTTNLLKMMLSAINSETHEHFILSCLKLIK